MQVWGLICKVNYDSQVFTWECSGPFKYCPLKLFAKFYWLSLWLPFLMQLLFRGCQAQLWLRKRVHMDRVVYRTRQLSFPMKTPEHWLPPPPHVVPSCQYSCLKVLQTLITSNRRARRALTDTDRTNFIPSTANMVGNYLGNGHTIFLIYHPSMP